MSPVERLLAKLPGATKTGTGWAARCPAHADRRASLSVAAGDDGRALLRCHAGCATEAVVAAVGLRMADLMPPAAPTAVATARPRNAAPAARAFPSANEAVADLERRLGERSAVWTYHDAGGDPVGLVVRWDRPGGKDIRPVARAGGGWRAAAMPDPRPLYRLPELTAAGRVVVTEGEKAADAARGLGFVTTTSAGGSQAAAKTDWSPLAGKEVWVLPDNDPPGRGYAAAVAAAFAALTPAPVVRVIDLPGLPSGGDVVDWIAARGDATPAELRREIEALAAAVAPAETEPAIDGDTDSFRPFPVDALPAPVRGFVAAGAEAIGCDPSYLALPLLTVLAAAIGTTRRLELKRGWSAPAVIWGAVVGESGTAKTPAFKLVLQPVRDRQRKALERHAAAMKRYDAELARWDKDMTAWKRNKAAAADPPAKPTPPAAERCIVADTTVEAIAPILSTNPRGLLLARDELASWLGSFDRYSGKGKSGADEANWLSMYNAESILVDRKTGTPSTIHVPVAAVCVTGGIQPGVLHRALGVEHRESGLAARLLLTCPPRRAKRWTDADIDPRAEADLARLVDRLYELQPAAGDDGESRPILVRLTPAAKAAWTAYYNAHAAEHADLTGDLSAAWSKLEEYAARLALVVHFVRWAADDPTLGAEDAVDLASMAAGIRLATWFKAEARRVYALLGESDTDRDQRRLVEWVGRRGGAATARDAQQGCRWLKASGAAEAALEALAKAGRGRWQVSAGSPAGGRPKRTFVLSAPPAVSETGPSGGETGGSVDVDAVDAAPPTYPDGRLFPDSRGLPD